MLITCNWNVYGEAEIAFKKYWK